MDENIMYKEITPNSLDTEQTDNTCNICMEENENKIIFDCTHTICLLCYEKLLNSKLTDIVCPFCRGLIEKHNEITINNDLVQNDNVNRNNIRNNIIKMCIAIFLNFIIMIIIVNIK